MTVTLEIPSEIETGLQQKAEEFGLSLSEYLLSLAEADLEDDYSLSPEEIENIQQGLAELRAGERGISLEDYRAEVLAARQIRQQQVTEAVV